MFQKYNLKIASNYLLKLSFKKKMIKKSRLDLYLLYKGLCETRQKAQGLILAGKVKDINGKIFDKPGHQVLEGTEFIIESEPQFVSRGGEKLLEAFKKLKINVKDRVCIDAGISTCLLYTSPSPRD